MTLGTTHQATHLARANPATGSTTFCAMLYKGERYDFKTQKAWSASAPTFGIPFGSKVLTVEIRLPDSVAMPNQYRDKLLWRHDRSDVTADQYAHLVRELMPEWVKEIIRQESPDGVDDLNDLQADLQKLLDELRVPAVVMKPTIGALPVQGHSGGTPEAEATKIESEEDEDIVHGDEPRTKAHAPRAAKTRVRQAPQGATASRMARALERAPEIKILVDPEQIAEKNIKSRAGRFIKETQTLFINGLYPAAERMAAEIIDEVPTARDPEEARQFAVKAAQRTLALRVGKATCFALAKKLLDDWSSADLDRATSPESLSLAADDYRQSIPQARRWMKEQIKIDAVMELG